MKLVQHDRRPQVLEVQLTVTPLTIWLDPITELTIDPGDRLADVALVVREHLELGRKASRQLVAYWFALGERIAAGTTSKPWSLKELRAKPGRCYYPKR